MRAALIAAPEFRGQGPLGLLIAVHQADFPGPPGHTSDEVDQAIAVGVGGIAADGVDTGALDSEIQFSTGARGKAVPIGRRGWCLAMGLVAIGREGHSEAARRVYTRQEENAACWRQLATRSACVCGRRRRTDRSLP